MARHMEPSVGLETCCHGGAKKETLELATRESGECRYYTAVVRYRERVRLGKGADDMPAELTELKVRDVAIKLHRAGRGPRVLFLRGAAHETI